MADLDNNILKDEEKLGGFGLTEPDDDSFSLNDENYPGDIYRFVDESELSNDLDEPTESDEIDDPALIGYIQGLQSAMTRKGKKSNSDTETEDAEIRDFERIDDSNADTHIDISDMDLDKPSIALAEGKTISLAELNKLEAQKEKERKKKEKKERIENVNEEEKKKIPLFIWIGSAAVLLLIAGVGAYFQFFNNQHSSEILSQDSIKKKSEIIAKNKIDSAKINNRDTIQKVKSEPLDLGKLQDEKLKDSSKKSSDIAAIKVQKDSKVATTKTNINSSKPKETLKTELPKATQNVNPKVEKIKQVEKKISKDSDIASSKSIPKTDIKQKAIEETYTSKKEPQYKFSNIENDIEGVYIVQIYSSPSKEDAELWLNKLKSRNINDGFISEQIIRDKVWYRVRFGNFSTRSEARSAALRLGFSQTWIDRVK